jgi:glycine cleavage system H protein
MNIPADLKYTRSHEWVRAEADGTITIGITEHAQELLGDLVFIELPDVGANLPPNRRLQSSNRSRQPPTSTHR